MARRLRDKTGAIVAIELTAAELAETLHAEVDELEIWSELLPEFAPGLYRVSSVAELNIWRKRAALLRTRMNVRAVQNVEKAGLLDAYASLAEDCPSGVTAHVWRSYGLIVLMQVRYGRKIDAAELAERASLTEVDPETGKVRPSAALADKHLRLLAGLGLLRDEGERWEHQGLPSSWRGA